MSWFETLSLPLQTEQAEPFVGSRLGMGLPRCGQPHQLCRRNWVHAAQNFSLLAARLVPPLQGAFLPTLLVLILSFHPKRCITPKVSARSDAIELLFDG